MTLNKVVLPVAGLGTRFLPATKAVPKELLPIIDQPIIQYAVDEAVAAGFTEVIFVNSDSKSTIKTYFDPAPELERELGRQEKHELLAMVQATVCDAVSYLFTTQDQPRGLGHAVLCARELVEDEPFAVVLPDDLIDTRDRSCLAQMVSLFAERHCSIIAVEPVPRDQTRKYGIVCAEPIDNRSSLLTGIVEKPDPLVAPTNLAVVGRYIFTPAIMEFLAKTDAGAGGEIQLTDAIAQLLRQETVLAYQFEGRRYDCGNKLGYLQATLDFALRRPELRETLLQHLAQNHGLIGGDSSSSG